MSTIRTTRTLVVGVALVVASATLLAPTSTAAVSAVAIEVAGVSTEMELSTDQQVLDRSGGLRAPVVVDAPQIPALPPARTPADEPALAEHVAVVSAGLVPRLPTFALVARCRERFPLAG